MLSVVVKYKGEFLDEISVDAGEVDEAVEEAKERVREILTVNVDISVEYDGQTLEKPDITIDLDEIIDEIIEDEFEFEVESDD